MHGEKIVRFSADVAPFLFVGLAAGQAAEIVAIEGFAHQELAHRTVQLHPMLAKASRATLLLAGMSPNVFAAEHRWHHAQNDAKPLQSLSERIAHVLRSGGTIKTSSQLDPEVMLFPGFSFCDDPLLRQDSQGHLAFRHHGRFERFIGKGVPVNFLPMSAAVLATAGILKKSGQTRSVSKSAALFAGFQIGLASQAMLTTYAEASAGRKNNTIDVQSLPKILRSRTVRHQQHHEAPEQAYSGSARRHIVAGKILRSLRLVAS